MAKKFEYKVYGLDDSFKVLTYSLDDLALITKTERGLISRILIDRINCFTGIKDYKVYKSALTRKGRRIYNIYNCAKAKVKTCYSLPEVALFLALDKTSIAKRVKQQGKNTKLYNVALGYFLEYDYEYLVDGQTGNQNP